MSTILHVDMDAFFAAVEQHDRPALRGQPVVVGAAPDQRGVVAAASYEAREYGIHSAMPSREAGRRCPHAVFLPPNGKRYAEVSRQIFGIFERFTPLLEPLSIDEAFLDVTGVQRLFGDGRAIGRQIKAAVQEGTGLTASVGVATNKFLAKLASDLEKPDGLTVVPETREAILAFLAPLSVSRIWGVGRVTREHLEAHGIRSIGDLQVCSEQQLGRVVGKHSARHLSALAHGEDARDVEGARAEKSISKEHTFGTDTRDAVQLEATLCELVEDVGRRLRAAGQYASLGRLKLRWEGFKTITRQRPFQRPVCDDFSLREMALSLFRDERLVKRVRLLGFGVSQLSRHADSQLTLFDDVKGQARKESLSRAMDSIRDKFGEDIIGRRH